MKSLCIIPFYNEESRIKQSIFEKIFTNNSDIDFLLVNDGSLDKTEKILSNFKFNNVYIKNNYKNVGKAETIRIAFLNVNINNYNYIGFLDSDLATPFDEFHKLLNIIQKEDKDIIFGSRVQLHGYKITRNTLRHFFSRIVITFLNIVFHLKIYDTQCGCKIFKSTIVNELFQKEFKTKWLFDIEIFIRYFKLYKIDSALEFPLNEWNEIPGTKIKLIDYISVPFNILKLIYEYKIKS